MLVQFDQLSGLKQQLFIAQREIMQETTKLIYDKVGM